MLRDVRREPKKEPVDKVVKVPLSQEAEFLRKENTYRKGRTSVVSDAGSLKVSDEGSRIDGKKLEERKKQLIKRY